MFYKLLKNRVLLLTIVIIVLFILLNFILPERFLLSPTRNFFLKIFSPLASRSYSSSNKTSSFLSGLKNLKNLSFENEELKREVIALKLENSRLKEVDYLNSKLKEQLGLKDKEGSLDLISASVISHGSSGLSSEIWLSAGKSDGVTLGEAVVSNEFLIGKITEVENDFSKVTLIVDPNSVVNVILQDSRATGIVRGGVGFNLHLESVPPETNLKKGDKVITSGLGKTLPKGLIVGDIEKVTSSRSDLFQTAEIKSQLDFASLELVFIVKEK